MSTRYMYNPQTEHPVGLEPKTSQSVVKHATHSPNCRLLFTILYRDTKDAQDFYVKTVEYQSHQNVFFFLFFFFQMHLRPTQDEAADTSKQSTVSVRLTYDVHVFPGSTGIPFRNLDPSNYDMFQKPIRLQ